MQNAPVTELIQEGIRFERIVRIGEFRPSIRGRIVDFRDAGIAVRRSLPTSSDKHAAIRKTSYRRVPSLVSHVRNSGPVIGSRVEDFGIGDSDTASGAPISSSDKDAAGAVGGLPLMYKSVELSSSPLLYKLNLMPTLLGIPA